MAAAPNLEDEIGTKIKKKDKASKFDRINSANSWENAELGDDDRKKKFLKLMGATKKQHHGRFVIGDNKADHGRTQEENEAMTRNIEGIYRQGLQHKLTGAARRHTGFGFHPDDAKPDPNEDSPPGEEPNDVVGSINSGSKLIGFCKAGTCVDESGDHVDSKSEGEGTGAEASSESRSECGETGRNVKSGYRVKVRTKDVNVGEKRLTDNHSDGELNVKHRKTE